MRIRRNWGKNFAEKIQFVWIRIRFSLKARIRDPLFIEGLDPDPNPYPLKKQADPKQISSSDYNYNLFMMHRLHGVKWRKRKFIKFLFFNFLLHFYCVISIFIHGENLAISIYNFIPRKYVVFLLVGIFYQIRDLQCLKSQPTHHIQY